MVSAVWQQIARSAGNFLKIAIRHSSGNSFKESVETNLLLARQLGWRKQLGRFDFRSALCYIVISVASVTRLRPGSKNKISESRRREGGREENGSISDAAQCEAGSGREG